jgi:type II secretory pathway predicted ATPase ExeA
MFSDVMAYYGLARDFQYVGFFETEHSRQVVKELRTAVKLGRLIAVAGIMGCGKTTTLEHIQQAMKKDKDILISTSLTVQKQQITLDTLMTALFYDVATEKGFKIPKPESRERTLRELIVKRQKPIALFIDEAQDLHVKTLLGLKRLNEVIRGGGGVLSIVLVGQPKLKNDLRQTKMAEIGSRAIIFELEGIRSQRREYIDWLLKQCLIPKTDPATVFTSEALDILATRLGTALQIEDHLTRALEEAYKVGQKPVKPEIVESVLTKDLNDIEPTLLRNGYNVKTIAELVNVKPAEIRQFLSGRLDAARMQELQNDMLKAGIPL